ncbi:MAG: hypothetical protein ACM3QS_14780 [Bacteroidota bacterium]
MSESRFAFLLSFSLLLASCSSGQTATATLTPSAFPPTTAPAPDITPSLPPTPTSTPLPVLTPSPTFPAAVPSLKAVVTANRLSCRYGPGAEYLYLYGLRGGANIVLIGRTDGNNWVWVEGRNRCWVNAKFIQIDGDRLALPVVYPGTARLPRSPYYPPTTVLSALRDGDKVTVEWLDIPLRSGDEEDASMLHYLVETWRCQDGQLIFDPLATNETSITFVDQPGCAVPSRGRVFVQEKHGFAGPAEIPWPGFPPPVTVTVLP